MLWLGLTFSACGGTSLSYHADTKQIIDQKCVTCHQPDAIGPFPLTTFEEVTAFSSAVRSSVASGSMPPWMPSDECNTYLGNIDLTEDERTKLLEWLDGGAPEGDPADAPPPIEYDDAGSWEPDVFVQLPEPYTPQREPDDYRCQLVPWPAEETRYVTALRVIPDQKAMVHHVIVFVATPDQVEQYRAWDAAEEGPGYTCYGGPSSSSAGSPMDNIDVGALMAALRDLGLTLADLQAGNLTEDQMAALMGALGISPSMGLANSLGSWVPGNAELKNPPGTGIKVEPGSMLVVQMHYNTNTAAPAPDQSRVEIATVADVDRPAVGLAMLDLGWVTGGRFGGEAMDIPAGAPSVSHSTSLAYDSMFVRGAREQLGLAPDAPLLLHTAIHHMHELGISQRTEVQHADGGDTCLLDIPAWDFNWQARYSFAEPVRLDPGDTLWMGCTWDNSAENQPVIDGEARVPADVSWGEGTSDEMCLASFYVTATE
jgi:hypothetical protein